MNTFADLRLQVVVNTVHCFYTTFNTFFIEFVGAYRSEPTTLNTPLPIIGIHFFAVIIQTVVITSRQFGWFVQMERSIWIIGRKLA